MDPHKLALNICCVWLSVAGICHADFDNTVVTQEEKLAVIAEVYEEVRSSLPIRLDDNTTLVDVELGAGKATYRMNLDWLPDDPAVLLTIERQLGEQALRSCNNPSARALMAMGYTVTRVYQLVNSVRPPIVIAHTAKDCAPPEA